MSTATAPPRKGRGKGRLKPQHLDYIKYIQSGIPRYEAAIKAGFNQYTAQKAKQRIEGLPEVQKLLELAHVNAQLEGQYGRKEAVEEVDKAIAFAYQKENPAAIAKLLEHKSKLFGLLIERVDVTTTYIDLKGALEAAKQRVLVNLNPVQPTADRGIVALQSQAQAGDSAGNSFTTHTPSADPLPTLSDSPTGTSTSIDNAVQPERLQENDASTDPQTQA